MIQLIRLKWSNWFSYGPDNEIYFTKDTLSQILGDNGAGKSSIPLILEEVLYNKNSKKIKKADILNRNTKDKFYSAELDFTVNDDEYQLQVVRRATLKVKLTKNGEDISSHTTTNTYKTVEEILGVRFDVFTQLIYQSTSSSLNFLTATDATRKNFLSALFRLDRYQDLGKVFTDLHRQTSLSTAAIEERIRSYTRDIEDYESSIKPKMPYLDGNTDNTALEQWKTENRLLQEAISNIDSDNEKVERNNFKKRQLDKLRDQERIPLENPLPETQDVSAKQIAIGEIRGIKQESETRIKRLKTIGSYCPTCEQKVHDDPEARIEQERSYIKEYIAAEETLTREIREIEQVNAGIVKERALRNKIEQVVKEIDPNLPDEPVTPTSLQGKLKVVQQNIHKVETELHKQHEHNSRAERFNSKMETYEGLLEKRKEELKEAQKNLESLSTKATSYEVLKKVFGTSGLIAYKIENLTHHLHKLINSYLVRLSGGRFTLAFKAEKDKLNVTLTDNEKEINIQALSSGELARVNCATLLGIRSLLGGISNSKINLLILDEVINVLDVEGRQTLVEILWEEPMNTFLVSHAWTHPLLQKVEVRKEDGFSTVNYD